MSVLRCKTSSRSRLGLHRFSHQCDRLTSRLGMAPSQLNVPTLKDRPQLEVIRLHQPLSMTTKVEDTKPNKAVNNEKTLGFRRLQSTFDGTGTQAAHHIHVERETLQSICYSNKRPTMIPHHETSACCTRKKQEKIS